MNVYNIITLDIKSIIMIKHIIKTIYNNKQNYKGKQYSFALECFEILN